MLNFIKNIGLPELIILAIIVIVFFGAKKTRELSRGLGESAKELKKVKNEIKETASEMKEENTESSSEDSS